MDANKTRNLLKSSDFNPSNYIAQQVANITNQKLDNSELQLMNLFSMIGNNLTAVSEMIEEEVLILQEDASTTETSLLKNLDIHSEKLTHVWSVVEEVQTSFLKASEGAVRIGSRLATSDKEKLRLEYAVDLMEYVNYFQSDQASAVLSYERIDKVDTKKLKELMPAKLREKDWGEISQILNDLKKILFEINSNEVIIAQKYAINLISVVETELLGQFDLTMERLMFDLHNENLITQAKKLAMWLHLYNNGQSVHTRYIFSVVQRIPMENQPIHGGIQGKVLKTWKKIKRVIPKGSNQFGENTDDDDDSSAGASMDEEDDNKMQPQVPTLNTKPTRTSVLPGHFLYESNHQDHSLYLIDQLSGLFGMINQLCQEQFEIIRKVFPTNSIAKITRLLVQRIFNDPAFGIQTRVDAILKPKPPTPPLTTSDYLDALVLVREKLSALYVLLLECSSHPSMLGMGSESTSLRKSRGLPEYQRTPSKFQLEANSAVDHTNLEKSGLYHDKRSIYDQVEVNDVTMMNMSPEESTLYIEERIQSDSEIRDFFDEQIAQVLSGYVADYFDREMVHIRTQYLNILRKGLDETTPSTKVMAGSIFQIPRVLSDKLKSIPSITKTILNKGFFSQVFQITSESVQRMESVGRDEKKLPHKLKELFLLHLSFVVDGVCVPCLTGCTAMLLKILGMKASQSSLPPKEVIEMIGILSFIMLYIKEHFENIFSRSLLSIPNVITFCKEKCKISFRKVEKGMKETLHAWTLCISSHIENILYQVQSKYDYSSHVESNGSSLTSKSASPLNGRQRGAITVPCTAACEAVCKTLNEVSRLIQYYDEELEHVNMVEWFWNPFGQLIMGVLISHLKKQRITEEGSAVWRSDLDSYMKEILKFDSPETIDMMVCFKQISSVFQVNASKVSKIVLEDLRYMDILIVLSIVRCRADYSERSKANHWYKTISSAYPNFKWDALLPWENKKQKHTLLTFHDSVNNSTGLGPSTLRKSSAPVSMLYMTQVAARERAGAAALASSKVISSSQNGAFNPRMSISSSSFEDKISIVEVRKSSIVSNSTNASIPFAKPNVVSNSNLSANSVQPLNNHNVKVSTKDNDPQKNMKDKMSKPEPNKNNGGKKIQTSVSNTSNPQNSNIMQQMSSFFNKY